MAATVSAPDPMITITRSASGEPWYSKSECARPVSAAKRSIARCTIAGVAEVEAVDRLAILEEDVGVLRRAAQHRAVRRQAAGARRVDEALVDHRADDVVVERLDLLQLVRRAEAVEEVQERHARLERRRVRDRARGPAPPAPTTRRAARSRCCGRPSRRCGRRRSTARAWRRRAPITWKTAGVSSPAILNMLGIISSRPWLAVNVVASPPPCSAPCTAPAAPASLCISTTDGTVPQRFGRRCGRPGVGRFRHARTTA